MDTIYLVYLSAFSTLLVSAVAGLLHNRISTRTGKGMLWYFYFRSAFELLLLITAKLYIPNYSLVYVYCILEVLLITYIIKGSSYITKGRLIWPGAILLVIGVVVEAMIHYPKEINAITRFAEGVFIMTLCSFWIFRLYSAPRLNEARYLPEFWLSLGLMIYFSVHIWVAIATNYAYNQFGNQETLYIWVYNSVANTLTNCMYLCWLGLIYRKTS